MKFILNEVFTMMDDDDVMGDGPENINRAKRSTGADQFNQHHADYENKIPQEPDQIQAVINHNKHPVMINEINRKKSLADAGMKKRERECRYCDPSCRACRAIMFFQEIPKVAFDPKCKACRKLKAWRERKGNIKAPCKSAAKFKPKRSQTFKSKSKNKKVKSHNRNRHELTIKDSREEMDNPRCGKAKCGKMEIALTQSETDMVKNFRRCKRPNKRDRECDSCSTDDCSHEKKKKTDNENDSENTSKASTNNSEHKIGSEDSVSSYHDYGDLGEQPMV